MIKNLIFISLQNNSIGKGMSNQLLYVQFHMRLVFSLLQDTGYLIYLLYFISQQFKNIYTISKICSPYAAIKNIGCTPHVVQYILGAYLTPSGLDLLVFHPRSFPPDHWCSLARSLGLYLCLFYVMFTSLLCFLDSTYN